MADRECGPLFFGVRSVSESFLWLQATFKQFEVRTFMRTSFNPKWRYFQMLLLLKLGCSGHLPHAVTSLLC